MLYNNLIRFKFRLEAHKFKICSVTKFVGALKENLSSYNHTMIVLYVLIYLMTFRNSSTITNTI